jgi:hypothetical protein
MTRSEAVLSMSRVVGELMEELDGISRDDVITAHDVHTDLVRGITHDLRLLRQYLMDDWVTERNAEKHGHGLPVVGE